MAGQRERTLTFIDGRWLEGNPPLLGPRTHAAWLASVVFDGARAFGGATPDLDRHCERVVRSAWAHGLKPVLAAGEILELCHDGIGRFPPGAELYIRPMFFGESGFVAPDPDSTRFCLSVWESPLPEPRGGMSACLSPLRRPGPEVAPTVAKASCLYPQSGLALQDAKRRGFDDGLMLDPLGNVAEFCYSNVFVGRDGAVHTPVPNGTFLNGITRQRVIALLRAAGIEVHERTLTVEDVRGADELFATGNHAKVMPYARFEDRDLQPGPLYARARELYWEFALG
ncbi:MAG TPA: branched-chain amino acid aminotransferase [Geminicoccaceae bacterium]|nr:branched-chain amino acid aminotransferase [Geminicoccaceae bacterium]